MVENINWPSFGAGVAVGVGATVAFNRASQYIAEMGEGEDKAVVKTAALDIADKGYIKQLVEVAQKAHLFGHKVQLNDILIEPHFIRPPDFVSLPDEDADIIRDVFEVVPRVHDYPYLHAPYNITNIEIDDLGRGDGTLILIGNPGSGRTTTLMTIALWSSGFVDFQQPDDVVAQQLRELEDDLTPQEQAERVKRRVALMERARQRFVEARAEQGDADAEVAKEAADEGIPLGQVDDSSSRFRQLAPLYVHLANVLPATGEYGQELDPAEPFVRGLQAEVGWLTSKRLVGKTYRLLEEGQALVLIDGYDDIPHHDRPAIMTWLKQFITMYKENFIIVAMPPTGYGPLMDAGAMPVFLRPWDDQTQQDHANKYVEQWEQFSETPIQRDVDEFRDPEQFYKAVGLAARGMNPLENTLHVWTYYNGIPGNESEQMDAYLRSLFPEDTETMLENLYTLAATQLDDGYITHKKLVALAMERELANLGIDKDAAQNENGVTEASEVADEIMETEDTIPEPEPEPIPEVVAEETNSDDDDLEDFFGHLVTEDAASDDTPETPQATDIETPELDEIPEDGNVLADVPQDELTEEEKAVAKRQGQISREQANLLKQLVEIGLLNQYRGGRYMFRHPFITGYLAARFVADADPFTLLNKQANPDWEHAICYLAQMRDIDFLVAQKLSSHSQMDVLHDCVLSVTRWLRFAGTDVSWRNNLLRYLGNLLVATNQFTLVRERIAAALLGMRDDGALVIFRRAIGHPNPDIRRLGCLGVGVLRDDAAIEPLTQRILQDDYVDVQTAAALALSAIGTEAAYATMFDVFEMSNERDVRKAIAESFAANREFGYPTLFDTVKANEMMIRRSSVYGLGRVRADWALITLNETYLEDDEFYVRLAAESVFTDLYEASLKGVNAYPEITEAEWLTEWIENQIEIGMLPLEVPRETYLDIALKQEFLTNDGEPTEPYIRLLATSTIGQLGITEKIAELYMLLRDREEQIRDEAYRALGEFQTRFGKPLPAPLK